jgi:hypothetical protein
METVDHQQWPPIELAWRQKLAAFWSILAESSGVVVIDGLPVMYIPNAPERSYWECEWRFPKTGTVISIGLPGGEDGPTLASRLFYLALAGRFEEIMASTRPKLKEVLNVARAGSSCRSIHSPEAIGLRWREPRTATAQMGCYVRGDRRQVVGDNRSIRRR